jgi:hypothetical protein
MTFGHKSQIMAVNNIQNKLDEAYENINVFDDKVITIKLKKMRIKLES